MNTKKHIRLFLPFLFTFCVLLFIGCSKSVINGGDSEIEIEPVKTYSVVETTDYTLPTGCRWVYTVPVGKNSGISIINSQEELVKHVSCGDVPSSVDFIKYSLLLAYGDSISNVHTLSYQLFRDSENEYKLDVNFLSGTKTWLEGWTVALLLPKIPQNTVVQLNEVISQGNPGEFESPYMDDISGVWRLWFSTAENDTVNFSGKSVIYEFKEDGKLIVTGSMPGSLAEGEHTYAYKKPNVCQTCSPVPNMRIDNDDDLFCEANLQNQTIVISGKKTEQGKTVIRNINLVKADMELPEINNPPESPGEFENPYMDDISGIWKFSFSTAENDTVNFSGKSVIYEFKEDGKLIVTGSMPGSLAEGEHTYAYKKPDVCQTCSPVPNMRIDNDDDLFCEANLQYQTIVISGKKTEQGKTVIWNINLVKADINHNP